MTTVIHLMMVPVPAAARKGKSGKKDSEVYGCLIVLSGRALDTKQEPCGAAA